MNHLLRRLAGSPFALTLLLPAAAGAERPSLSPSFRIGTGGVLCTAQIQTSDPHLKTMFDRGYRIVCRDAAASVGQLFAVRATAKQEVEIAADVSCDDPEATAVAGISAAQKWHCELNDTGLGYVIYAALSKGTLYTAEGLSGYDSVLRLGLQSLVLDRTVPGKVEVAVTEAGDATSFARVQAGNLDPDQALAEGYLRNNEGSFAESAEFFEILTTKNRGGENGFGRAAEYLANEALQQSNLGNALQAERLFGQAMAAADRSDPLILRLLRNLRAIHQLNIGAPEQALTLLNTPLPGFSDAAMTKERLAEGYIDRPLSQRLSIDDSAMVRLAGVSTRLSVPERAALFDAQAQYLRGAAMRLLGKPAEARTALRASSAELSAVRGGAVVSMNWLRAAALSEIAAIEEADGNRGQARKDLEAAIGIYALQYPDSAALLSARGRLAGLLARNGETEAALSAFRDIVSKGAATPGGGTVLKGLIQPYFDVLTDGKAPSLTAAGDFFAASQTLTRPGVAQTQAIFARELSGGSDEAARLFRQSLNLSRELVRIDGEIARMRADPDRDEGTLAQVADQRAALSQGQTELVALLSDFPRYRVLSNPSSTLVEFQAKLKPGEAYYKMSVVGTAAYAMLATATEAKVFRLSSTPADLETLTERIRDSITRVEDGQQVTEPFDVAAARQMYLILFGPVDAQLKASKHLIFEPDGALLKLPANLLVADQAGVDGYLARAANPDADAFDFRGVAWLGRDRMISTAVSAQAFLQVRTIAPSKGSRRYFGLGNNAPALRTLASGGDISTRSTCDWPLAAWGNPISPAELKLASSVIGGTGNTILTGQAFSDDALISRDDLADYRVIHFATHGLVTAPRPECPARPALLTSFGGKTSDGLLSFREIFDLRLDADTIILSACDTAGEATVAASREAGISTGGNFPLDGLVRAFVGAGARAVVASHWPVPDDFGATTKLVQGLFAGGSSESIGEAMRESQVKLMDDANTSHPYYWSAFAIVGDASKPIIGE